MIEITRTDDRGLLLSLRMEVLSAVFGISEEDVALFESLRCETVAYYRSELGRSHFAFICTDTDNGAICGSGAVCMQREMPSPDDISGLSAYIMNVYVRPQYRGRGLGRRIVKALIAFAQGKGCGKIYLETTDMARKLYAGSGFRELKDMMIYRQ